MNSVSTTINNLNNANSGNAKHFNNNQQLNKKHQQFLSYSTRRFNIIFTARGLILLLFVSYLVAFPILKKTDIIATVISSLALALIASLYVTTLFFGKRLRKKISLKIFPPEPINAQGINSSQQVTAKEDLLFVMRTNPIKIPPGFVMKTQLHFSSSSQTMASHIVSGSSREDRLLIEKTRFPHRGNWRISKIEFLLEDRFGLTHYEWNLPLENLPSNIRINPRSECSIGLPIVSSANRAGDTFPDTRERHGDAFDLKQYHPSDGVKKILWKIYARSGELIARHPEASMTPEGQAIIFCMAGRTDEHVCAATLSYIQMLEKLNIEISFGCQGMGIRDSVNSSEQAADLLVDSVWSSNNTAQAKLDDFKHLLQDFHKKRPDAFIQNVIITCPVALVTTQEGYDACLNLARCLEASAAKPIFFFCSQDSLKFTKKIKPSWLSRLLFNQIINEKDINLSTYYQFTSLCKNSNWEIYEQEVL